MEVIFTGNVSKEGQRIVKASRGGERGNILTQGLVILFMINTVSTLAVKEKTPFSKCNLFFILFLLNEWTVSMT